MGEFQFIFDITIVNVLLAALGVILIDTLLGIVLAIAAGEFDLRKLPKFLQSAVFPYVGSLVILAAFAFVMPDIKALLFTAAAAVVTKFLAEIKDKLSSMSMLRKETQ